MSFYDNNLTQYVTGESDLHWKTADSDKQGFDSRFLVDGTSFLSSPTDSRPPCASFLVIKREKLIWERYFNSSPMEANNVHSVSKTILSTLVEIALEKGDIDDLSDSIECYLKEKFNFENRHETITVEDLLTLRSGLAWIEDTTEHVIGTQTSWVQAILDLDQASSPGEEFNYSSGDTHLLGAVLESAAKMSLESYAQKHLFDTLGIRPTRWTLDPNGINCGGFNFYMSPRELAKLARLFLQKGAWCKQQLVRREWIDTWESAVKSDYHYLWNGRKYGCRSALYMEGFGRQYVYLLPDDDVAVVITFDTYEWDGPSEPLEVDRFIKKFVIPALPNECESTTAKTC